MAIELEKRIENHRSGIAKQAERQEFDRQWGIVSKALTRTIHWSNPLFITRRIVDSLMNAEPDMPVERIIKNALNNL